MAQMPWYPRFRIGTMLRLLVLVLILLGLLVLLQRKLIYFPERPAGLPEEDPALAPFVVRFAAADGTALVSLFHPPPSPEAFCVLLTHGNAGCIRSWQSLFHDYRERGFGALLLDPRGYGWSAGKPNEAGWHQDAEAAWNFLTREGIAENRIVVHGISIGGGMAVPLAAKHQPAGLILQASFTSLADAARSQMPFLPVGWLLWDRYENLKLAPAVKCPVLLLHGTRDRIVSVENSKRLHQAVGDRGELVLAKGFGHNDLPLWPEYWPRLQSFLHSLNDR
ncbi:MAG: alpha/beta fold hydrolase [Planctomycetota bacterium]|nr:MAG: alpha/beta fold hydrolase [Planctomycetota bacterium]